LEIQQQFVVVGSGQAGGWAAKTLRDAGFTGSIVVVGNECHPPYERPPLSKAVLTGHKSPESCYLWSRDKLGELGINVLQGVIATGVNRSRRELSLSLGSTLTYDRLLLATGATPRRLTCPGADLEGIYYLRTIEDSIELGQSLNTAKRLLVVGGGWIGLEVAASAVSKGIATTLVEAADRLCGRSLPLSLGSYFLELHEGRGVDVRLNVKVKAFEGRRHLERVVFDDGSVLDVSAAVIGIGVEPNTELAGDCGLQVDNGIVVDARNCTSDPNIFAAGDVANQPYCGGANRVRLECWKNAQDQGIAAARAMLDQRTTNSEVPWFWSDQYDVNFQMIGFPMHTSAIYQKGDRSSGRFIQYFVEGDRLTAAAAVNSPRDLRESKRLMMSQQPFETTGLDALPRIA
jgi:3-phenylpropionate/trans-cinnamate dioxygenase ferredoxin reductase subunit